MAADSSDPKHSKSKRNFLLFFAGLTILYPVIRFLGFSVPRKPKVVELNTSLPAGGFHLGSDYILFDDGEKAWALSRRCTHLGCTINYHEKKALLECPCHQSRFSKGGEVLHGPAKAPLPRFQVERLEGGGGYIITI